MKVNASRAKNVHLHSWALFTIWLGLVPDVFFFSENEPFYNN